MSEQTKHQSHDTRFSDSSLYSEVCKNCGATDIDGGGWGELSNSCKAVPLLRVEKCEICGESQAINEVLPHPETGVEMRVTSCPVCELSYCKEDDQPVAQSWPVWAAGRPYLPKITEELLDMVPANEPVVLIENGGWTQAAVDFVAVIPVFPPVAAQSVASVPKIKWKPSEVDPEEVVRALQQVQFTNHVDGFDIVPRELISAARYAIEKLQAAQSVSKDVEEFIARAGFPMEDTGPDIALWISDLRTWMAGHARVPVDILGISEFALRRLQFDTPKNGTDYELITRALNAMLTASKEGV